MDSDVFFNYAPNEHIQREKSKARELRQSQWWKNKKSAGKCYYCQKTVLPSHLTMDHVVPVARGGRSVKSNVVPACKDCNTAKKTMVPMEWQSYLHGIRGPAG